METIVSVKNERVKMWKKLQTKKGREKVGTYLIEGFHLIDEAIKNKALILEVMLSEDAKEMVATSLPENKMVLVSQEVSKQLSETQTTQGIFAVVKKNSVPEEPVLEKPYLFLDNVQDPGNLGTMIRTADAAGFGGVVLGKGTVDLYNNKVIRSMQGSHFHLPIYQDDLSDWFELFQNAGFPVYGTELNELAVSYRDITPQSKFAVVMGNEGNGMSKELLEKTTKNLYIPIMGQAESLNVAVAAGILMFALTK
ncbi:TrmH family RNA methyltransferase [Carnobacterium funditum]|uniref:TrmH family RNA methyltransferase n=1 Tax=Carnobacterium funditum TaxID=2752 RepID=UPI0005590108|nr:RNA methyltransferase [Carnobacterium funditum]